MVQVSKMKSANVCGARPAGGEGSNVGGDGSNNQCNAGDNGTSDGKVRGCDSSGQQKK